MLAVRDTRFRDIRKIVEGIIYHSRTGIPWRDLPREAFGPWQTVWKRHCRCAAGGTWDRALAQILAGLMMLKKSTGRSRWIPRLPAPISMGPTQRVLISPQGAGANHENPGTGRLEEPEGYVMGRSRGGLSSKLYAAVDGNGRPWAVVFTGGQRNDAAVLVEVIDEIRVPDIGPGKSADKT